MMTIHERLAAAGLRVTQLVWTEGDRNGSFYAEAPLGKGFSGYYLLTQEEYDLATVTFGVLCHEFAGNVVWKVPKGKAKAAAQADHEARILAALEEVK